MQKVGLVSLLFVSGALAADPLLENNNNNLPYKESDVPECPANVPVTSTNVPGVSDDQRLEISTNEGKCFRIFNCIDDKPVSYSEYSCKISDIKGNWWGDHFYQDGLPVFILNWDLGNPTGGKMSTRNVIARKEYLEMPAPNAQNDMTWARYPILSDDGTNPAKFKYVERAYTRGGQPPASCNGETSIQVPYQAYYYFYPCKEPKVAAIEEPKETPKPAEAPVTATVEVVPPSVEVPPAEAPTSIVPTEESSAPPAEPPTESLDATPEAPVEEVSVEEAPIVAPAPASGAVASSIICSVVGLAAFAMV